ncbi:uncharacterized protein UTRI_03873_B [Ustilago trichophora]|uniref:DNA endonuclease activator Ctp1 C-terminal domain-containing protein n=1 Tax=Ustilago trichophora TaxID=86804 RepID=A0A5C3E2A5_9BASI|nr:uncharacterized protein UTRI_03873_B [Ustilago trichophora]
MSSSLKRKRTTEPHLASPASTSTRSSPAAPQSRRSTDVYQDPTTSSLPHDNAAQANLRHELQLSLNELHSSSARIEAILAQLGPQPRSTLSELVAPVQPSIAHSASSETALKSISTRRDSPCAKCLEHQAKIRALQAQAREHEKERQAWKAFKSWWLASLSKRERGQRRRKHLANDSTPNAFPAYKNSGSAEEALRSVVRRLDPATRKVWERAGVISSAAGAGADIADEEDREGDVGSGEGRLEGSLGESAGQQSELTLPLHATPPSAAVHSAAIDPNRGRGDDVATNAVQVVPMHRRDTAANYIGSNSDSPSRRPLIPTTTTIRRTPSKTTAAARTNTLPTSSSSSTTARTHNTRPIPITTSPTRPTPTIATTNTAARLDLEPTSRVTSITTPHPTSATRAADLIGHIDSTPIRNPLHRRTLHASDCPDCTLFYSHFNSLAPNSNHGGNRTGLQAGDVERMACSRHRSTYKRAVTPDGYWNIGFPSTQEAQEVNAQARLQRPHQR